MDYASGAEPNAGSVHDFGKRAARTLAFARGLVAKYLDSRSHEIIFTSSGTESNNLAIQGSVWVWYEESKNNKIDRKNIPHIIITNIEHSSVLETCRMLEKRNLAEISIVLVEQNGIVDAKKIKKAIKKNTALVSVMYANNEIGTIQPISEIAKEIRHFKKNLENNSIFPIFHTDAVQAVNYLDLNTQKLGVDLLSLSGAKIKDAGRVGVLFKKTNISLQNIFGGGDQEFSLRPGTENLPAINKFAKALQKVRNNKERESKKLFKLREYFILKLLKLSKSLFDSDDGVVLNGDVENSLPNIVSVTFGKIPSELLVIELSTNGVMVSSKSACKEKEKGGSYVIKAIHPELDQSIGAVRFSFGASTAKDEIDYVIKTLSKILLKLKKWYD